MAFDYSTIDLPGMLQRAYEQMDDLQRPGVARARKTGRVVYHVWMGVGKSFMGLTAGLCFKPQTWLIIGSKNSLNAWRQEIKKWFPELGDDKLFKVVRGTEWERHAAYKSPALFYATTAGAFIRDIEWLLTKKVKFDVITVDEIQKLGLRNYKTEFFKSLKLLIQHIEKKNKHPIKLINFNTGTWTSKGNAQQWPALHLLDPKLFSSYWRFVHTFNIVINTSFGKKIVGPQNTQALAEVTYPYVYTVSEEEAKTKLPELRRHRLTTDLPSELWAAYDTMAEELYMEIENNIVSVSNALSATMKLRQLVCCPKLIHPSWGEGPIIEAICEKIEELEDHPRYLHNIIFTPFVATIPIFKEYLQNRWSLPANKILSMQGGLEIEEVQEIETQFRRDQSTVMICSTKYSESFNLETTLNCYHVHFEWDQDQNKQAEARARRKSGTQEFINSYYGNIRGTITEDMLDVISLKEHVNKISYQDITKLKERLKRSIAKTYDN